MSFPRYPEYKESGVEWLGEVPRLWDVTPLKHVAEFASGGTPDKRRLDYWDGDIPWASAKDMKFDLLLDTADHITATALTDRAASLVPAGTVLVVVRGMILARFFPVVTTGVPMAINQDLKAVCAREPGRNDWLAWLLRASEPETLKRLDEAGHGTKALRMDAWADMRIPVPTAEDQEVIARFLDHETSKIDALVDAQQRLIELLKEKRQAVISQAVTKGLDPNVPMKDSGVEWLGKVPAHWSAVQLGRLCSEVSDGPHFSPTYVDDGVMFLSARNIGVESWHLDDAKFISERDYTEFSKRIVPELGDVLYTKGGTTGVARVVDLPMKFQVWVHVAVLKLHREAASPHFVAHALNSIGCYEQAQLHTRGATNQDLGLTRMVKIWLALPPLAEQRRIELELNSEAARIDALTSEAQSALALLQERRTALISAAVTGKIDVRGLAA